MFWGVLVKFASAMTFGYTLVILFIFLHDFDEDSDFAARRRHELIKFRELHGEELESDRADS
jgi:uncharacterized membrane protein YphA (DoxX/SURF4 family)